MPKIKRLPPVHPGEILLKDFLEPLEITRYRLAKDLGVDPRRIHSIVEGQRAVTAETALMLAKYFGTSAKFWMGIQSQYDLEIEEDRIQKKLNKIAHYEVRASV